MLASLGFAAWSYRRWRAGGDAPGLEALREEGLALRLVRGGRTWLVKTFPKTATKVKAVKLTFANNVSSGYKEVDAVQLVGQ